MVGHPRVSSHAAMRVRTQNRPWRDARERCRVRHRGGPPCRWRREQAPVLSPPRGARTSKSGALLILALLLSRGGDAHADWMSIGPAGGVVTALAIDPSNPRRCTRGRALPG